MRRKLWTRVRDKRLRHEANKAHRTYQSPRETEKKGCMPQWIVNKVLGMYGDY